MPNSSFPVVNRGVSTLPYLSWGAQNPTVVPTPGIPGMIFIQIANYDDLGNNVGIYQKVTTAGNDTNWQKIGPSGGGGGSAFQRQPFVLSNTDITNGYVDLNAIAAHDSVIANLEGAALLILGSDYTLSDGAVTRLTFDPSLIPLLGVGQLLQVQFN